MKKFGSIFRKIGITATDVPDMLAEIQAQATEDSKKMYYVSKLGEKQEQKPMTEHEDIVKAIENMPEDKVVVFMNLQLLNIIDEKEFIALHKYIEFAKESGTRRDFYRGFHHGPCIIWAFTKEYISEKINTYRFFEYPTVALYL